jgi:hypothetical protein
MLENTGSSPDSTTGFTMVPACQNSNQATGCPPGAAGGLGFRLERPQNKIMPSKTASLLEPGRSRRKKEGRIRRGPLFFCPEPVSKERSEANIRMIRVVGGVVWSSSFWRFSCHRFFGLKYSESEGRFTETKKRSPLARYEPKGPKAIRYPQ